MKILIFIMLISNFIFAQTYSKEKIIDSNGKEIAVNYFNDGTLFKTIKYNNFNKNNLPLSGLKYEIIDNVETRSGTVEYFYNNNILFLIVDKNTNNSINQISWFYEKNGELIEELRDSRNNILRYYSHFDNKFEDITKRIIESNSLDKLVILEKDMIKSFKPLESLQDILFNNPSLNIAQTLRSIDFSYSDRMESLGNQLVTDSIKEYTKAQVVIMPALSFKENISIGSINYEHLKNIITEEELFLLRVDGNTLIALIENFLKLPSRHREFLHLSGLTFEKAKDKKLVVARVEGSAIDPRRLYTVIAPKYVVEGNGIFFKFTNVNSYKLPYKTSIILANYLRELRIIDDSYKVENRIGN